MTPVEFLRQEFAKGINYSPVVVKTIFKLQSDEAAEALLREAQPVVPPAPVMQEIATAPAVEEKLVPEWETPAHTEVNLAAVEIHELGLDPFSDDPLVDRIIEAHEHPNLALVPVQLKQKPNWVRWKLEEVNGRLTKIPYQLNGNKASSANPETWNTYDNIVKGAVIDRTQGIGIMTDGTFIGFDLDGCLNPQTRELAKWAQKIVDACGYVEITPSGTGVRGYVAGTLLPGRRRFAIDVAVGFGDKVGIEAYSEKRFFTVTGERLGSSSSLIADPNAIYELCETASREYAAQKRKTAQGFQVDDKDSSVQFHPVLGTVVTSKLAVLMYGQVTSQKPFVIKDEHGNEVTAPSQSEADMSLATLLAMKHGDDADAIDTEFRESSLYRPKWDRLAESTIQKAMQTAARTKSASAPANVVDSGISPTKVEAVAQPLDENVIPPFDDSVITGIFRDIVDLATNGTTIPRQFAFLNAKVYFGARLAGRATFEDLNCDSSYYGTPIGATGTSKGESWRRTMERILLCAEITGLKQYLKIIHGADSGAGLKDTFFDPPQELPVLCYIDEVMSIGHKAGEKKNPEILDTIGELADTHHFSRVKAAHGKGTATKTHDGAYLSLYACGQDGEAFMSAFTGRTKVGLFDRFYPEYSDEIEAGNLPEIPLEDIVKLHEKIAGLNFDPKMTVPPEISSAIEEFWKQQLPEIRKKIRFKKYLKLDMYMAAWSRGVTVVEQADLDVAIKIFTRQMVIRKKHFVGEVPDRIGFYIGYLKRETERMHQRLLGGEPIANVALSLRDFQTNSNAWRDNELHIFEKAWRTWEKDWLARTKIKAANGHEYDKYTPVPLENEFWATPGGNPSAVKN
jgi:hypothetical protein